MNNVKEWTSLPVLELLAMASRSKGKKKRKRKKDWERVSAESSCMFPRRPNRSKDWTELNCAVDSYRRRFRFLSLCLVPL